MVALSVAELESVFADGEYLRQRLYPHPGDIHYLCLADLLLALKNMEVADGLRILDYGAGASPYRSLFGNCEYRRADIAPLENPDYLIAEDGTVPEVSSVFDMVLSTQVLEHVNNPANYLAECFRLLKPGGKLVLSTHGSFEDHGCPYDFQRWTAEGLRRDLKNADFEVLTLNKLTTGPRAMAFLIDRYFTTSGVPRRLFPQLLNRTLKAISKRFRPRIHTLFDRYCSNFRVVPSDAPNHIMYIVLFACARRPL